MFCFLLFFFETFKKKVKNNNNNNKSVCNLSNNWISDREIRGPDRKIEIYDYIIIFFYYKQNVMWTNIQIFVFKSCALFILFVLSTLKIEKKLKEL